MATNPPLLEMADRCIVNSKHLQTLQYLVDQKPGWWQWLLDCYCYNRLANFIVCRWPGIPEIITVYRDWVSIQLDLKFMGLHNPEMCVSLIESIIDSNDTPGFIEINNDHQAPLD